MTAEWAGRNDAERTEQAVYMRQYRIGKEAAELSKAPQDVAVSRMRKLQQDKKRVDTLLEAATNRVKELSGS